MSATTTKPLDPTKIFGDIGSSNLKCEQSSRTEMQLAGGMKLEKWRKMVGISRTAAWRMRKEGKLPIIVRYGISYLTAETIKNFFTNDGTKLRGFNMMPTTTATKS